MKRRRRIPGALAAGQVVGMRANSAVAAQGGSWQQHMIMRRILLAALVLGALAATFAAAIEVPPLAGKRFHNLSTSLALSESQAQAIEEKLARLEREQGGIQMAVLIIESLEGESLESYSLRVAEQWNLGMKRTAGKEGDNGLLLTVAVKDRKYRFEVGYGLEGVLPDGLVGSIGRAVLVPAFQSGRYTEGIDKAIEALTGVLQSVNHPPTQGPADETTEIDRGVLAAGIMIVVAAVFGIVHFLLGGVVGFFEGVAFSWFFVGHAFADLLVYAIVGFVLGMAAKIIVRIALELGISGIAGGFSGGGGSFGGGGASGNW